MIGLNERNAVVVAVNNQTKIDAQGVAQPHLVTDFHAPRKE
jgi:hypothetical protein